MKLTPLQGDPGEAVRTDTVANEHAVYNVIECLDQHSHDGGDRKPQQQRQNGIGPNLACAVGGRGGRRGGISASHGKIGTHFTLQDEIGQWSFFPTAATQRDKNTTATSGQTPSFQKREIAKTLNYETGTFFVAFTAIRMEPGRPRPGKGPTGASGLKRS